MKLRPVSLAEARRFIAEHHRHNVPPIAWRFGVGLCADDSDDLIGVAIAEIPKARLLMDGRTVEISRVCTLGDKYANSMLYGAILRAAKSLGYTKAITYTLESESGSSLKAVGFHPTQLPGSANNSWVRGNNDRAISYDQTIWGDRILPTEDRIRWEKSLVAKLQDETKVA